MVQQLVELNDVSQKILCIALLLWLLLFIIMMCIITIVYRYYYYCVSLLLCIITIILFITVIIIITIIINYHDCNYHYASSLVRAQHIALQMVQQLVELNDVTLCYYASSLVRAQHVFRVLGFRVQGESLQLLCPNQGQFYALIRVNFYCYHASSSL